MVQSVRRTRSHRMNFCVQRGLGALPSTSKAEGKITAGFFPLRAECINTGIACHFLGNIHVRKGRIYGLLGRNGAGKTTTMRMLLGLTAPTSGNVKIFGKPFQENEKKILPRIGCLIESPGFYPNLTGTENLKIFAELRGLRNPNYVKGALELVNLPYRDKKLFSQYSLGMKQRLAIALAVMHDPELLILDEPINGLDPIGIAEVRSFIRELCDFRDCCRTSLFYGTR